MHAGDGRKLSTNEKLVSAINSRDYEADDIDVLEAVRDEEKKAILRVKKNAFYGVGSRAKIPKVKKPKGDTHASPFTVLEPLFMPPKPDMLSSVVQPGAHQDQYRIIAYPTEKSRRDPDRVFFTTTSYSDGIQFSRQPPWYFGYENKTKPADSNIILSANRYGYRGSKEIKQRHTEFYEPPSRTRNEHTPKFLTGNDMVDEWVPPILAAKYGTVNNLETPKLWPQNAEFVTGSKMKKMPSIPSYNRETTVGSTVRPMTSEALDVVIENADAIDATLVEYAGKEITGEVTALPAASKSQFEHTWHDRVVATANPTLRQTMRRVQLPYEAHTLMDPSDTMRYSGSTAVIVHTQSSEEVKFRMRMQRSQSMIPYELKWKLVMQMFKQLKGFVKKDVTVSILIKEVGNALRRQARQSNTPTSVSRLQFISALNRMNCFESYTDKNLSAVYSVFDPMKHDCVRYVELVLALALFDHPLQTSVEKAGYLWELATEFGSDEQPIGMAQSVLLACCANDADRKKIENLFKSEFKPLVYKMTVESGGKRGPDTTTEVAEMFASTSISASKSGSLKPPRGSTGTLHPHNITDHFLTEDTFCDVLDLCDKLNKAFDDLLSARLRALYGRDARYEAEEEEDKTEGRDFSWILDNKRAAAAAFAAAAAAAAGKNGTMLHPQHYRHQELLSNYKPVPTVPGPL